MQAVWSCSALSAIPSLISEDCWIVHCIGQGHIMEVSDACVSWLSHASTNTTFFPKPPTTFLMCFRGEKQEIRRRQSSPQLGIKLKATRS